MNQLIKDVSKECGIPEYMVAEITNRMSVYISEKLILGETVEIPKLGTFKTTSRKKMQGTNLLGGNDRELGECTYPIFQVSNVIKSKVKTAYSCKK